MLLTATVFNGSCSYFHQWCDTPCEFQSDRTTLDFWPKSCRTAQRLDSGQLGWVLGRLGCVLGTLGWVQGQLGWVLGPLRWVYNPDAQLDAWILANWVGS